MQKSLEQYGYEAWADAHFPLPTYKADDQGLEKYLRDRCVKGAGFFLKFATGTNQRLHMLAGRTPNMYSQYFLQSAKPGNLENAADNFRTLCTSGGYKYTNEYQYCTVLRDQVDPEVVERARELLAEFNIEVP